MGRVVGWTLLILGAYVVVTLVRDRGEFRMRSRWMLLFAGVRRLRMWASSGSTRVHDHEHAAVGAVHHGDGDGQGGDSGRLRAPTHRHPHAHDGDAEYGTAAVAGIGMLHGIGAETPTQLVIFLAAANAGGVATGIAVLAAFIAGLIVSNSAITLTATLGFRAATDRRRFHTVLGGATAVVSVVVGTLFVFGAEGSLPVWFAG
jgi:high-affinity nickel-transport protein